MAFAKRVSKKTRAAKDFLSPEQARLNQELAELEELAEQEAEQLTADASEAVEAGVVNDARVAKLESQIEQLQQLMLTFYQADQVHPDFLNAIAVKNDAATSVYKKSVAEGGASSYSVAKEPDGVFKINNKLVAFYDLP